jgi:hypothetical protein
MRVTPMLVEGVKYEINWRKFRPGTSIFIPCLHPAKAKAQVLVVTKRLRINVLIKSTIEDRIRGLRIWRERI